MRAAHVLRRAVPFDAIAGVWFDPETGLAVDEWIDDSLAGGAGSRLPEIGVHETDIAAFRQLAASGRPAASMSDATGGTFDRSRRPRGLGDELRSVYFGDSGMWCGYVMYRERGAPDFAGREVDLIASLNGGRSDLQRVRLQQDLSSDVGDGDAGLLLLDDQDGVEMANPAAAAWLDELGARRRRLPVVVSAVAQRAREIASGDSGLAATARARTASGRWITVRGWVLQNGSEARTAITLEPARGPELAELLAEAYGLTARERRVSRARRARPAQRRDRRPAVPVDLHGPGPPQGDLREARRIQPRTARRQAVPRPHPLAARSARLDRQGVVEDLVGIPSALRFLELLVVPAVVQRGPRDA